VIAGKDDGMAGYGSLRQVGTKPIRGIPEDRLGIGSGSVVSMECQSVM